MSDPSDERARNAPTLMSLLRGLAVSLVARAMAATLDRVLGHVTEAAAPGSEAASSVSPDEYRRELHSYLWGLVLASGLTLVPFALVYWSLMARFPLYATIGAFALVQVIVHFRFFLHIGFSRQKMEDLQLILFSTLILMLMAGGTIWVLRNLATRMH